VTVDNLLRVRLRAINPDLKHDREYKIGLGQDLFQQWYVVITFGRYGSWGTSRTKVFNAREEAYNFINTKLRRRLTSPKRISCSYQIVSFDGAEEILETMSNKVIERFSWFENRGANRNTSTT
jgi:predicted DNA-binding WGR domain protein